MAFLRTAADLSRNGRARQTINRWAKDTAFTQEELDLLRSIFAKDKTALKTSKNKKLKLISYIDRLLFGVLIGRRLTAEELSTLLKHHKLAEEEMREIMLSAPLMFGSVTNRVGMITGYGNYRL